MDPFAIVMVVGIVFGSTATVITVAMDKFAGGKQRAAQLELEISRERAAMQEQRVADLERLNDQLTKSLEWHERLAAATPPKSFSDPGSSQALPSSRL